MLMYLQYIQCEIGKYSGKPTIFGRFENAEMSGKNMTAIEIYSHEI